MSVAGHRTLSTGASCSRVTNGLWAPRRPACVRMAAHARIMMTPSQKGKKPLRGPSVPQPMPMRSESATTTPPSRIRIDAVATSTARILFLQQTALGHQVLVQLLVLLDPFHVLGAGCEGGLERAIVHVFLPLRRLGDLPEEGDVPVDRILRHAWRTEDPAEHQIVHVDAESLLDRRNVLPLGHRHACRVEDRERPDPAGLPVAHALDGV